MELSWDYGTAYDFFASIHVLHKPAHFGLRGAWAAGVRSRLPGEARKILEQAEKACFIPLHWLHGLPQPKDASSALSALAALSPAERLPVLSFSPAVDEAMRSLLLSVGERGRWGGEDLAALRSLRKAKDWSTGKGVLESILSAWAEQESFGSALLEALQAYYEVFFAEEEDRIALPLQEATRRAQTLAKAMPWPQLLETLSQGVRFSAEIEADTLVLTASYWTAPLVVFDRIGPRVWMFLFGARPADVSLVPGEVVPEALLRSLKALSDPTRLRILRYLSQEPMTPSALARKLRLRAPTVVHHLSLLRLAGLVYLSVDVAHRKSERFYMARSERVQQTFAMLNTFLSGKESE